MNSRVEIETFNNHYVVKGRFDEVMLDAIKKITPQQWDVVKNEYTLPINSLESFTKDLTAGDRKYHIKENTPTARITKLDNMLELKFTQYVTNLDIYKHVPLCKYDAENQAFYMPNSSMDDLIAYLQSVNYCYVLREEKRTAPDFTRPGAQVIKNGDKYEIKFTHFIKNIDIQAQVDDCEYDKDNRQYVIPIARKDQLIEYLNKIDFAYKFIEDDEQKPNVHPPKPKSPLQRTGAKRWDKTKKFANLRKKSEVEEGRNIKGILV